MSQRDVESKLVVQERAKAMQTEKIPKNMTSWLQGQLMLKLTEPYSLNGKKTSKLDAMLETVVKSVIERNDIGAFKAIMSLLTGKGLNGAEILIKLMATDIDSLQKEMNLDADSLTKLARNLQTKKDVIDVDPISNPN